MSAFNPEADRFVPRMETDVCLRGPARSIILDTKFYASALKQSAFGEPKLPAANLYQLYTYLRQKSADTGWEQVATGEWESARDWCRRCAGRYGLPLHVVSNPRRTLLEEVAERGKFPSAGQRWCTAHHKRNPIQKWIRNHVDTPCIVNAIGIRAEESPNRRKMLAVSRDWALSTRSRTVFTWYPIFDWPLAKVWNYHEIHDLPIHPVYGFLPRFSCRVCIFHRGRDLAAVRRHDPASFAIWSGLEEQIRFTANPKGSAVALADAWEAKQREAEMDPFRQIWMFD